MAVNVEFDFQPQFDIIWQGDYRELALYSGRGAGKSWAYADYCVLYAFYKKRRILCCREIQNSISDSVLALLAKSIENRNLDKYFNIQKNAIYCTNGSEFIFKGIKHSIESIKSMANIDLCWIEEAQTTSDDSINILLPTIFRNKGAKILYSYNRRYLNDAVEKRFHGKEIPKGAIVKEVHWKDNRYFTQAMCEEMEYNFKTDPEMANHIWNGALMPSGNDAAVIPLNWLRKCVDAHKKLEYKPKAFKYMGLDFADGGTDKSAIAIRHGSVVTFINEFEKPFINKTVEYADSFAKQYGIVRLHFDAIGIGAGAKGDFNRLQRDYTAEPHIGSASPSGKDSKFTDSMTNGQFFRNLKAQAWWSIRLKVENTMRLLDGEKIDPSSCIFFDGNLLNIDKLLLELAQASYKHDDGKLLIDKSPDGQDSPNLADAVIMAFAHDLRKGLKAR
jgi:phage terminase large subunit